MLSLSAEATPREKLARVLVSACFAALGGGCGPEHGGDGAGGHAGEGRSGGPHGGGGAASNAGSAGEGIAGASAAGGAAGAGGATETAFPDAVIGCPPATWLDQGSYFEPAPLEDPFTREQFLLSRFYPYGISGDGRLVVGVTSDPPYRQLAVSWSSAGGLVELPGVVLNEDTSGLEARGIQASCDGSVILQHDSPFSEIYRTEGGQAPLVLIGGPFPFNVHMNPDASVIVDGEGQYGEVDGEIWGAPLRWTAETGMASVPGLAFEVIYGVAPDGTLIAGNADELFEYDVATGDRTSIGMAVVGPTLGEPSLKVSASGEAWAQSADLHYDSFLQWRPPAQPRSVTCPAACRVRDVSGTGEVVLLDVSAGSSTVSYVWTLPTGFIDLATAVEQTGVDLGGRKLAAVAISDDGRAVTGRSFDPASPSASAPFFYAVLPRSVFAP